MSPAVIMPEGFTTDSQPVPSIITAAVCTVDERLVLVHAAVSITPAFPGEGSAGGSVG